MRWLVLVAILLFIAAQISRLIPSKRDQQLQDLRQAATRAGLLVRFWTKRNSVYQHRQLPESGYQYVLHFPAKDEPVERWAVWQNTAGELFPLGGTPTPELARRWLETFRERFPDSWAMLECSGSGIGLLWQERGSVEDIHTIADSLGTLRENLNALPG